MKLKSIILILFLLFSLAAIPGCSQETEAGPEKASVQNIDVSGTYAGTTTITEAKNSAAGEVTDLTMTFTQNDDGTGKIAFGTEEKEGAVGTYNKETGEFFFDTGGDVSLQVKLTFTIEGDTVAARGTMTTNQEGEGWTQEAALELKRQ